MIKTKNKADAWKEAKKRCRLNDADIQMAKELGMTPKSLTKNIPSKDQQWKAPVKVWVSTMYEEKFGKVLTEKTSNNQKRQDKKAINSIEWDDLPF
ncbi:hypothetical protein [Metabacillus halosaccharovorans]|uniref:Uncharacterized protein n=1 Tax=Metabacillus halosaccharovorans TaxID=930124 RepID=A0ABT3DDQ2_9BACI|nr:hypothetical protein [Metabacillus halosaccharovorans]MCV9885077.1 hypothetical protein [Metabacillus halosaccharovorans]